MNSYTDNETTELDYSIQHANDIASATAEMAIKPAVPTGAKLPDDLVQAIIDGNPVRVLSILAKSPRGIVNDRYGNKGLTLLHIASLLYGYKRRHHHDLDAVRYDTICRILLREGANPLARAYLPGDSLPFYPSEFAKGLTPPSLRRRMLRETATDNVGWKPEYALDRVRQASRATIERRQRADRRSGRFSTRTQAAA